MLQYIGNVRKMRTEHTTPVSYSLAIGDAVLQMNELIGQRLHIEYDGEINCIACGRKTSKSFQQGYCFPCMRSLPECDQCIVRPELCHFDQGTCRDVDWGLLHCMQDHYLYLANSSGLKIGITRGLQVPTRWMDQGATQALPIIRADSRLHVGQLEVALKAFANDRTDWRRMLKGPAEPLDLVTEKYRLLEQAEASLGQLDESIGWEVVQDESVCEFEYPVSDYPEKVASLNLDKLQVVEGVLKGIKGQYLILDCGVMNIRKYGGYNLKISAQEPGYH
ncbi:MAG: DUF2797 domain-containing protein [Proteobacteria bacterium]|nr:DUF2797 domain-containing protein [Pseudomonadota bacterium]